jgi:fructose-bisphosphate aldolase class 1
VRSCILAATQLNGSMQKTISKLISDGKDILAADESTPTIKGVL